jgi:hypothetical protein
LQFVLYCADLDRSGGAIGHVATASTARQEQTCECEG